MEQMMRKYPVGIQTFSEIINGGCLRRKDRLGMTTGTLCKVYFHEPSPPLWQVAAYVDFEIIFQRRP